MKVQEPEPKVVCDKCESASAGSEAHAVAAGWIINYSAKPHTHVCPDCQVASANVELVERALSAFNERETEGFDEVLAEDFEWVTPTATNGEPRAYRGLDGLRRFCDDSSRWQAIEGHTSEIRDLGDRALVLGELRWRDHRGSGFDVVGPFSSVIHFDRGRITHVYTYRNEADAWAGAGLARRPGPPPEQPA